MGTPTERHEAMQQVRLNIYWRDKHAARLEEAIDHALSLGVTQKRLAATLGISTDTLQRRLRKNVN